MIKEAMGCRKNTIRRDGWGRWENTKMIGVRRCNRRDGRRNEVLIKKGVKW